MNIIERAKNILLTPKTEWEVIKGESATPQSLLTSYVLPMAVISCIGPILGAIVFTKLGIKYALVAAVIALLSATLGYYISTYIIDSLATSFSSEKNINKSAQLVAYYSTAGAVGGLLSFIPVLGLIISLAAMVYGIYIMYLGIGPMKNTPEDKKVAYMIVSFLVAIVLYFVLAAILGAVLFSAMGLARPSMF